jgi:hypothetical protein
MPLLFKPDWLMYEQLKRGFIIQIGPGGSMSKVVALPNNSCKPVTNTAWVRARFCKLQKGCNRLAATSDNVYQLLPVTTVSATTKIGRHDIAEILPQVALSTINQIKSTKSVNFNPTTTTTINLYQQFTQYIASIVLFSFSTNTFKYYQNMLFFAFF